MKEKLNKQTLDKLVSWVVTKKNIYGAVFCVSAVLFIDDEGKLTDFVAQRYMSENSGNRMTTWSTPMTAYGEFQGLRLPVAGKGVWRLPEGDFEYIRLTLVELEYDLQ